jgi:hypothetical protein
MGLSTILGPMLTGTVKSTDPTAATTPGRMRNTGVGDATQFGTLVYTTTAAANLVYTAPGGGTEVMVIPAGAYLAGMNIDVTVAFNAGTNNTITVQTATGLTIVTHTATGANITAGRYTVGSAGFAWTTTNITTLVNIGTSDVIIQAFFTGTGTAATTGAATISLNYIFRNPDGSYFPQTPPVPQTNPPSLTY